MTYDPNVPTANQRPSVSQPIIQNNFQQLNNIFDEDHINYTAAADNGEHRKISLNDPLAADPNLPDPKASLYTKTVSGDTELFFEKYDNTASANLVQQLTNLPITTGIRHGGNQETWITPWGMRFTCGISGPFSGTSTDNFLVPFTTKVFCVTASAYDLNVNRVSATTTLTQLILHTENNISVSYIVIGI